MKRTWVAGLTAFIVAIEFTQAATADISTLKLVQVVKSMRFQ